MIRVPSEGNMEVIQLCKICNKTEYKYVCPKCNILYCSLPCYKSELHLQCSEAFYKECIMESLKSQGKDTEMAKSMEAILKRVNEQDDINGLSSSSADSDDDDDIVRRFQDVDLDDCETVWSKLTKEEKQEFTELVRNGDATRYVPMFEPWWSEKHPKPKVKFVDDSSSEDKYKMNCPKLLVSRSLSCLTNKEASPLLFFNIINTLGAYCLIARYYNGNFDGLALEASTVLVNVSKSLITINVSNSIEMALASVGEAAVNCPWISVGAEEVSRMKADTFEVIEGPNREEPEYYTRCALSEIHRLFTEAKINGKKKRQGEFSRSFPEASENAMRLITKDIITKCIKKIEYYDSWCVDNYRRFIEDIFSH